MRAESDNNWQADAEMQNLSSGFNAGKPGLCASRRGMRLRRGGSRAAGILSDESGQALILAAVSLSVLMGAMALAVDVGFIHYRQAQLQTAADSAAIAAGLELGNCSDTVCANMKTAAEQALIEDGITTATIAPSSSCTVSSSSSLAMIINDAPCVLGTKDPNNGNAHMVEVVLTEPQSMFFGRLFGFPNMNLMARAEAGNAEINNAPTTSGGNCIWTGSAQFNAGTFNLTNCGLYVNGNFSADGGTTVTATDFEYTGTWQNPSDCNGDCVWHLGDSESQPTSTSVTQPDPLAGTPAPSKPSTGDSGTCSPSNQNCSGQNVTAGQPVAVPPGYYGGINVNSGVTVNLSPGLYYLSGDLTVGSGATLECTTCTNGGAGVTLYFTSGNFQPNSGSTTTLNAPATGYTSNGDVANMLVWESTGDTQAMTLDSSPSITLNGIIYLPDAQLILNSGSGTTIDGSATAVAVDVQSLMVDANITFTVNGSQLLGGGGTSTETQTLSTNFALAE